MNSIKIGCPVQADIHEVMRLVKPSVSVTVISGVKPLYRDFLLNLCVKWYQIIAGTVFKLFEN